VTDASGPHAAWDTPAPAFSTAPMSRMHWKGIRTIAYDRPGMVDRRRVPAGQLGMARRISAPSRTRSESSPAVGHVRRGPYALAARRSFRPLVAVGPRIGAHAEPKDSTTRWYGASDHRRHQRMPTTKPRESQFEPSGSNVGAGNRISLAEGRVRLSWLNSSSVASRPVSLLAAKDGGTTASRNCVLGFRGGLHQRAGATWHGRQDRFVPFWAR